MHIVMLMHSGFRRLIRRLARLAAAHREMTMLLRADERMLKDIGLTPGDAQGVGGCHRMAKAAAARRNEAMAAASRRRLSANEKGRTVSGAAFLHSMDNQMVGLHGTGTSR
jgi:uncharacterized protein YjiS (DUF1127 family)